MKKDEKHLAFINNEQGAILGGMIGGLIILRKNGRKMYSLAIQRVIMMDLSSVKMLKNIF